MSISEAERHEIYELIKSATSDRVANNVMSMLPPVGWADVATKTDLRALQAEIGSVRTEMTAEIGSLRSELHTEIGSLRSELHTEIGSLRTELHTEIGSVHSEIGSLRADMKVLRANLMTELHQSIRSQTWALVAWTTGLAGLIVALGR
jgi:hypothetical protein